MSASLFQSKVTSASPRTLRGRLLVFVAAFTSLLFSMATFALSRQELTAAAQTSFLAAQHGLDEYLGNLQAAAGFAQRIIEIIATPFATGEKEVSVGTSIGIALAPEHGSDADDLMKMADLALYRVKATGRNNFRFFEPEMRRAAKIRSTSNVESMESAYG